MEKRISCGLVRVSKNSVENKKWPEISKGDVVTIENENNRNGLFWKICRVGELIKGRDNVIRGARE